MSHSLIQLLWNLRFRGKVRLLSPLVPKTGRRTADIFGAQVSLDLADHVQRMVYLGCFESEETSRVMRELKPGMTFLDIGSNCGYFSYLASRNVGLTGRVISVEPSPLVADILEKAIRENNLKNVELHRVALGPRDGELTLYVPPPEVANHAPTTIANPGWTPITVPVHRLDDLLESLNVDRVDLLKIDVEGFEGEVFAGAERSLNTRIRSMLVEFNEWCLTQSGTSGSALWDRIVASGFVPESPKPAKFEVQEPPINCFFRKP